MQDDARSQRENRIAMAAYELIEEKGYSGTSMLAIARRARASNETLYNWYGDKLGLFSALISRNAEDVGNLLDTSEDLQAEPLETLEALGPILLDLLLGERAIALNRAAVADPTGELGQVLSLAGRNKILPKIGKVLMAARKNGDIVFDDLEDVLHIYISLLIGDLQIRRAIGALDAPNGAKNVLRAKKATARFLSLLQPRTQN